MKAFGMAGKLAASGSITMQNIGGRGPLHFSFCTLCFNMVSFSNLVKQLRWQGDIGFGSLLMYHVLYFNDLRHCLPAAMSSYLYIVKYELPLVIKAFLNVEESTG